MINRITVYLTLTLLIMSIVPMFGAAFFIEDILNSQAAIYKAPSINKALENSQLNLKKLAKLDSPNEPDYREQFEQLQDLKLIYGDDLVFNGALQATLRKYFFLGFGVILFASLVLGLGLSRLIDKSFKILLKDYEKVRERSRYLENLSGWQEIAKSLAHEIKRPLMPIKTWLSNLAKVAGKIENPAHAASVGEALESMNEELNSLRKMVDNFARFGKLSEPEIQKTDLRELLSRFMQENLARPGVTLSENFEAGEFPCLCDASIFKQTLSGLVDNAAEANPGTQVEIKFSLRKLDGFLELEVFNSGREIYAMDSAKIFEPYFSTKMRQGNMGLGLAIAKMNILKQNGDILHVPVKGGVLFKITLPALGKRDL